LRRDGGHGGDGNRGVSLEDRDGASSR
jgi:hypothetical protein